VEKLIKLQVDEAMSLIMEQLGEFPGLTCQRKTSKVLRKRMCVKDKIEITKTQKF